ncbi:MAG: hypothetical protein HZA50_15345 [Planctomycetes bacterium]|nr:hypothetical protein [Planctomycetota bacterium]
MMKTGWLVTLTAACLVSATVMAADPAPVAQPASAKMVYEAGNMLAIFTKSRVLSEGLKFNFSGDSGEIKINGTSAKLAAKFDRAKNLLGLGLDTNRDGTVDDKEFMATKDKACGFRFKDADGRDCQIVFNALLPGVDKSGQIKTLAGAYYPNYCMKGVLAGQTVRLVDEDMNGTFSQDGNDGIVIGNTAYALPLCRMHLIAGKHYQLEVASDGASITATPADDLKLGLVEAPLLIPATKTLVLMDDTNGRAYDLVSAAKVGIPEGTYSFCYAAVTSGANSMSVYPTAPNNPRGNGGTPKYPISPDAINVLSLGPSFKLYFEAFGSDKINVNPGVSVFGSGNEYYALNFASGGTSTPSISMYNGKKLLSKEYMAYG